MKKFFISAVMAIAALTASAQQPAGGLSLTPHFGMGYAIASEKILGTFNGYITAVAGVEATYKATDLFGVSLGFDYGYGSTFKETANKSLYGVSYSGEAYFDHYLINIPVMAQLHFGQVAFKAGIQPGWVIAPKYHVDAHNGSTSASGKVDLDDNVNAFQLCVPVGITYSPTFPMQFDLRYSIPLNYYDHPNDSFKLGTIMLTVGYRFDLGNK